VSINLILDNDDDDDDDDDNDNDDDDDDERKNDTFASRVSKQTLERMCSLGEVHGTKVNTYYNSSTWKFSGNYAERETERGDIVCKDRNPR